MITKNGKTYSPVDYYRNLSESGTRYKYHDWIETIERHTKDLDIEAKALNDMITGQVLPIGMKHQKELAEIISGAKDVSAEDISMTKDLLIGLTMILSSIKSGVNNLKDLVICKNTSDENKYG